jgi:hypothetical protein
MLDRTLKQDFKGFFVVRSKEFSQEYHFSMWLCREIEISCLLTGHFNGNLLDVTSSNGDPERPAISA